jgi:Raf kinase inhibitor-like YbhB/YbcL family protein
VLVSLTINSPAFEPFGAIPERYTCDGADRSPPLRWSGVPAAARSLALIVEDPDAPDPAAPKRVFVHWVLYDLPVTSTGLAEGIGADDLPEGTREGRNDWQRPGYGGPCPPVGRHRYFFRLVALDIELPDLAAPSKAKLEAAMADHAIETAELVGTYARSRK